jgi:type IV secretion system protein VirB2
MRRRVFALQGVLVLTLLAAASGIAHASSAGMPWESPLNQLVQSLTGPVAKAVGVFAIVAVGFGMAFSEGGSGMRKVLWVVLGLAIAFSAASWGLSFMGFSGGLAV